MKRVIIMGAAGRDFHNFNVYFRDNPEYQVVAFTAAQIPNIAGRRYPPELAGRLYPEGIPIEPEERLAELIKEHKVQEVVFAYSDVSHQHVMERAAIAQAAGADFLLLARTRRCSSPRSRWWRSPRCGPAAGRARPPGG
jgi:predicted GTPase